MKVTASDADDPTYGSSARVVYSVLDGEKFFTVDKNKGKRTQHSKTLLFSFSIFFHQYFRKSEEIMEIMR